MINGALPSFNLSTNPGADNPVSKVLWPCKLSTWVRCAGYDLHLLSVLQPKVTLSWWIGHCYCWRGVGPVWSQVILRRFFRIQCGPKDIRSWSSRCISRYYSINTSIPSLLTICTGAITSSTAVSWRWKWSSSISFTLRHVTCLWMR